MQPNRSRYSRHRMPLLGRRPADQASAGYTVASGARTSIWTRRLCTPSPLAAAPTRCHNPRLGDGPEILKPDATPSTTSSSPTRPVGRPSLRRRPKPIRAILRDRLAVSYSSAYELRRKLRRKILLPRLLFVLVEPLLRRKDEDWNMPFLQILQTCRELLNGSC